MYTARFPINEAVVDVGLCHVVHDDGKPCTGFSVAVATGFGDLLLDFADAKTLVDLATQLQAQGKKLARAQRNLRVAGR